MMIGCWAESSQVFGVVDSADGGPQARRGKYGRHGLFVADHEA